MVAHEYYTFSRVSFHVFFLLWAHQEKNFSLFGGRRSCRPLRDILVECWEWCRQNVHNCRELRVGAARGVCMCMFCDKHHLVVWNAFICSETWDFWFGTMLGAIARRKDARWTRTALNFGQQKNVRNVLAAASHTHRHTYTLRSQTMHGCAQ